MTDFFLSPESERAIENQLLQRQRNFDRSRQQVRANPQIAERLVRAEQLSPASSAELKQAYALSEMDDEQFAEMAQREQRETDDDAGLMGRIGDVAQDVGMGVWDQAIKPLVRGAFAVVETASEEVLQRPVTAGLAALQGEADSFGEAYQQYGNSPGVVAAGNLFDDDPTTGFDLGEGFFTGGAASEESRAQRTLTINDETANFGRAIANGWIGERGVVHNLGGGFYSPGDRAYDLTAGVSQFVGDVVLDPVAIGTLGATKALTASKGLSGVRTLGAARRGISVERLNEPLGEIRALEQAGAIAGPQRNTAILEQARRTLGNTDLLDDIAASDAYTIMRRMRTERLGYGRGDDRLASMITRLGDETDPVEVGRILLDEAASGYVRERGFYRGPGRLIRNPVEKLRNIRLHDNIPEHRYGGLQPGRAVSADNPMRSATDLDALLQLGKVGEADRAGLVSRALRVTDNADMQSIVDDSIRAIGRRMEDVGVDPEDVEALITTQRQQRNAMRSYLIDEAGKPSPPPWRGLDTRTIGGVEEEYAKPTASLIAHLNDNLVPLPDPQDIRRATGKVKALRAVYQSNAWEMTDSAVRWGTRYLFKFPTLFTRAAYPLRNNLDNQARAAAGGYHSIFTNPVAWWNLGVGRGKRRQFFDLIESPDNVLGAGRSFRTADGAYGIVDDIVEQADGTSRVRGRLARRDGTEEVIDEGFDELSERVSAVARSWDEVAKDTGALTRDAAGMWADEGAKRSGAFRVFTNGIDDDFVVAWRSQLGRLHNDPVARAVANTSRFATRDELVDHLVSSGAIDEVARLGDDAKRFFFRQGDQADRAQVNAYVDYVEDHIQRLTGGDDGLRRTLATGDLNGTPFNDLSKNNRINQILREQYLDRAAPRYVSGEQMLSDAPRSKSLWKSKMDSWVDMVASRPENHFTRFPLLAEVFADDLARSMASLADDTMRLDLVERAARAGFDDRLFPQIARAAQNASGQRGIVANVDDIIEAAKLHSTDQMLDIAFDATQRSSFQEMADAFVPFWDAFTEVGTSWGRLLRDNPAAFARGSSAIDSLRDQGVVYVNEFGEEVFAYPGGGMLAKFLGMEEAGAPRFEGRLSGLNLVVQGFGPGVGPLVQWGASAFLPKDPDLQWIRDVITPYGSEIDQPGELLDPGKIVESLTPAWMSKAYNVLQGGEYDEVAYNSSVGDALKVLATTGGYSPDDPADQRRLLEDARRAGLWTMAVRSMLQMGAPTGPGVTWDVQTDPDGTVHRLNTMAGAWFELMQESGDAATANMAFIDMYGVEPFWITQGKTNQLREGPRTREGWNWIGRHPEAAERHRDVIGYFVPPEDPAAPPDYGIYKARLDAGDIEPLTPEQQLQLANQTKARSIYNVVRDRTEGMPSGQRRRTLSDTRAALEDAFPGWQADVLGVGQRPDRDERIRQLELAVEDEALDDSPVYEPLRAYLMMRRRALAEIESRGGPTTLGAQDNADLREWLRQGGQAIMRRSPAFQGVWQSVLSSEVQ